jgi:hypothetical protein
VLSFLECFKKTKRAAPEARVYDADAQCSSVTFETLKVLARSLFSLLS